MYFYSRAALMALKALNATFSPVSLVFETHSSCSPCSEFPDSRCTATVAGNARSNDWRPMSYTIGTAAKATGKAKSTISRDIKSGRISAEKQPDGSYLIDPSELHRVYPPVVFDNGSENSESNDSQPQTTDAETALLRQDNVRLLEQIEMLRDERDDLRRRLDAEADERRRLTLIVTDQRVRRRRWWLLGG